MNSYFETYHGHTIEITNGVLKIDGVVYEYKGAALTAAYRIVEEMEGMR